MADDDITKLKIDRAKVPLRRKRNWNKTVIPIIAGIVLLFLILYATGILRPSTVVEVANVSLIYPSQSLTLLNASGYIVPQRKAAVASKITGRLVSLAVEEGSRVKKGEVIANLENEDIIAQRREALANLEAARAGLVQAKAELKDARLSFEREKNLLAKEFTTKAAYDSAEARYRKADAGVLAGGASVRAALAVLNGTEVSLDYSLIKAPFDAVVLTKNADVGDIVSPMSGAANAKAAVVTIADLDSLLVEADVSESSIKQVYVGQPCEIQLDALPDKRLRGAVHMIVPTADRSKATIMVKVRFIDKDSRVLPEMSAKVAFLSREVKNDEQTPRTVVRTTAVRDLNGKKYTFLIQDNRVSVRHINTGESIGDYLEVLEGLKPGDRVVVNPPKSLKNGARVSIEEK